MNRQHILSRLGQRGWPILYSNGVPFTWELLPHLKQSGLSSVTADKDHIQTFTPGLCLPRSYRLPLLDKAAVKSHCHQLKRVLQIGQYDNFIVLCFDPDFYPFVEALNPTYTTLHIYDVYDKIGKVSDQFNAHLRKLLSKADLVTASTQYILDVVANGYNDKSAVIFNAADAESIQKARLTYAEPDLLKRIPHPRIGYLGAINRKMDFNVILQVIENRLDWQWVFIGPLNEIEISKADHYEAFCKIRSQPNTHFIGEIDKNQIPQFLLSMDVHVLCLRTDEDSWATHSYPLKLNEYLATGAPIVSTPLPVVQQECGELILFASTPDAWEERMITAIGEHKPELTQARQRYAAFNNWERRIDEFETLLSNIVNHQRPEKG